MICWFSVKHPVICEIKVNTVGEAILEGSQIYIACQHGVDQYISKSSQIPEADGKFKLVLIHWS